MTKFRCLIFRY